jgi:hypothetical protein
MWNDPVVDEVRKVRDEHAKKFNYDLQAIVADLKKNNRKPASGNLSRRRPKSRQCCQRQKWTKTNDLS